jgi:hypothetical protein
VAAADEDLAVALYGDGRDDVLVVAAPVEGGSNLAAVSEAWIELTVGAVVDGANITGRDDLAVGLDGECIEPTQAPLPKLGSR